MQVFYNDSQSIMVVNQKGKIKKLFTPFRVLKIANGTWVYVEHVGTNNNDGLVYFINGFAYPHSQFQIKIQF